jgi:hypothetical protein
VEVSIPFAGDPELATVFWICLGGDEFAALQTRSEGGVATATTTHFSQAFVGTSGQCTEQDCCARATGKLDVLFVVDNSNSMREEQRALAEQIPRMARVLASGDVDRDGTQEYPAVESLHTGVVTTDMGTGAYAVGGVCGTDGGDDGLLQTDGHSEDASCESSYPNFLEYQWGDDSNPEMFAQRVGCVARVGTGGCGFEHPLEASLKALTPASSPIGFHGNETGHGSDAHEGFLRDDSVLALVVLSDEDDCSAADPELFNPNPDNIRYPGDINRRCADYPGALHPIRRYVDGLLALRERPSRVVYADIGGVPQQAVDDAAGIDYDALLAHPRMQKEPDPDHPTRLRPSCEAPEGEGDTRGVAFPPRRRVRLARELQSEGAQSVVQSICSSDFAPAMGAILDRVAQGMSGVCR